ncbi:MAG: DUF4832 domain-containing protein, partial [Phycisphaerales bacterium]|nr:DUF4832 domain-containing protein [Phycisphaerales bacterium]
MINRLIMLAAFLLAALPAPAAEVFPAATTNDLNNPHKGFMLWGTDYADGAPNNFHGASVFHVYVPWREVETADQAFAWAQFEANHLTPILADYPEATFVLRLVADYPDGPGSGIANFYTGGETDRDYPKFLEQAPLNIGYHNYASCDGDGPGRTPDWNNPTLITQAVQLVQAFAQQYDGDPRITAVQVGLLGLWGEWHQSGCDAYAPTNPVKIAVRDAYSAYFTNTPLQTRYPRDPDAVGVEFGFHEDYFPSFTAPCDYGFPSCSDDGDWSLSYCFQHITPASTDNWQRNTISGESPLSAQKKAWTNDTEDILTVLRDYHFSFLGPAGAHDANKSHATMARLKRQLGYNLHVTRAAWPDQVEQHAPIAVTLELTNSGSAPPYHLMPVELAVCRADGTPVWTNHWNFDLRQVIPGAAHSFTQSFTVSGVATGSYSLRVGVRHPRRNFAPGVLLQNAGRDARDRYELGAVAVTAADADGDGMTDSWETN